MLGHQFTGHKERFHDYVEMLFDAVTRITAVQKSTSELDDGVAKTTEHRRKQHSDFGTLTVVNAAVTELSIFQQAEHSLSTRVTQDNANAATAGVFGITVGQVQLLQADPVAELKKHEGSTRRRVACTCSRHRQLCHTSLTSDGIMCRVSTHCRVHHAGARCDSRQPYFF